MEKRTVILSGYQLHIKTEKKEGTAFPNYQKGNRYTDPYAKKNDPEKPNNWQ